MSQSDLRIRFWKITEVRKKLNFNICKFIQLLKSLSSGFYHLSSLNEQSNETKGIISVDTKLSYDIEVMCYIKNMSMK
jgi:hypothetical protein